MNRDYFSIDLIPDSFLFGNAPYPDIHILTGNFVFNPCVIGFYNKPTSNHLLWIDELIISKGTEALFPLNNLLKVSRISSSNGGSPIQINSLDSSNPDLPSQVSFSYLPSSVTTVADFTGLLMNDFWNQLNFTSFALVPKFYEFMKNNSISLSQPITLREGEGIALLSSYYGIGIALELNVTFSTSYGTYFACFSFPYCYGTSDFPIISLMNNSGSGVVLTINLLNIYILLSRESNIYSFEPFTEYREEMPGIVVNPTPLDTSKSFSSDFDIRTGAMTVCGMEFGSLTFSPAIKRLANTPVSIKEPVIYPKIGNLISSPFCIRPGEGLCLIKRYPSVYAPNMIQAIISQELIETPSVGAGATGFSILGG